MIQRYIVAPDFSTAPPPEGPVTLGSVLANLSELAPLNATQTLAPPQQLPTDHKRGFEKSRSALLGGHGGIFAQVLALFGVGVEAGAAYSRENEDVLTVTDLETISFNPTAEYIQKVMDMEPVKIFLEAKRYKKPVFLVTGIKIARGASVKTSRSSSLGGQLKVGLSVPGFPGELGPDVGIEVARSSSESFESSSDFILAIRVRQIKLKKGEVVHQEHNKGATMMDGGTRQVHQLEIEDVGDHFDIKELRLAYSVRELGKEGSTTEDEGETILCPASE